MKNEGPLYHKLSGTKKIIWTDNLGGKLIPRCLHARDGCRELGSEFMAAGDTCLTGPLGIHLWAQGRRVFRRSGVSCRI